MGHGYARQDILVETDWLADRLNDSSVRAVEVDEDTTLYAQGHVPGAVHWNWQTDLQDAVVRDWASKERLERLLGESGIGPDTTVVLYGDKNNWFATYTFWLLTYLGASGLRVLNGGRAKWIAEGRPLETAAPGHPRASIALPGPDPSVRALRDQVRAALGAAALVDVRSPQEYSGELIAMPAYPQEGAQRAGHIPGAQNIPWGQNVREDGTFRPADELRALYEGKGITPDRDVITYCRIGERSSLTWFTLTYLLGYPRVKNYDGSWTEWGSLVGVPIENPKAAERR